MNKHHIEQIFKYNETLSKINIDRRKKYEIYNRMLKTPNIKSILLQNEKKINEQKKKVINYLLQDLKKKEKHNNKIYSNLSSVSDISKLTEYLK